MHLFGTMPTSNAVRGHCRNDLGVSLKASILDRGDEDADLLSRVPSGDLGFELFESSLQWGVSPSHTPVGFSGRACFGARDVTVQLLRRRIPFPE